MIAIGTDETAGSTEWGEPDLLRSAGLGVAWIVNGYNTDRRRLPGREILLDLWAPVGDGVVKVDSYDARLGPVSSVVAEAVLWMVTAQAGEYFGANESNGEATKRTRRAENGATKRGRDQNVEEPE